jgi:hypothetical protein
MTAVIIIGIYAIGILAYFILAGMTDDFGITNRDEKEFVTIGGIIWPIVLIMVLAKLTTEGFQKVGKRIGKSLKRLRKWD